MNARITPEELVASAEVVARQSVFVENLNMMNVPTDIEKRVKFDAQCMIARDRLYFLQADYNAKLADYVKAEKEKTP